MKKSFLIIIAVLTLAVSFYAGRQTAPTKVQNIFPANYYTEDMSSLLDSTQELKLVFTDSVDGRPVYSVLFPNGAEIDSMYPEEIANGLITGKWDYDEDFKLTK